MIQLQPRVATLLLVILLGVSGTAMITAMQRTSATFDEIVMVAAGARGYETGDWGLAPEHPPLVQFLYGLPVHLADPVLPNETGVSAAQRAHKSYRYAYAQDFFWRLGNDGEALVFRGRLPAVLCALALILLTFLFGQAVAGTGSGLLAALLVAALPDVLAHGGVAYNDLPFALAFVLSVWMLDRAVRRPDLARGIAAGVAIGLAAAVKNSAVALAPVAILLLLWEAALRREDRAWRRAAPIAAAASIAAAYLTLVLVYRGDFGLDEYRYGLNFAFGHVTTMGVPSYLLGNVSDQGWWYFFPVAFLYKTSAGLHVLAALATASFALTLRERSGALLTSRLRAPAVGLIVFVLLLLTSDLNIGFRYALPALPMLCILISAGVTRAWATYRPLLRAVSVAATLWLVLHVASYYPHFLGYISEYGPGRDRNWEVLVDSSTDWGQGLVELRDYMRDHDIPHVHLSYFGSALPEGYGIRYAPLASFFSLPAQDPVDGDPQWVAISATNLTGTYFQGDPFAAFRKAEPAAVLAQSIMLYQLRD